MKACEESTRQRDTGVVRNIRKKGIKHEEGRFELMKVCHLLLADIQNETAVSTILVLCNHFAMKYRFQEA